jgi:hypothetical protein
MEKKKPQRVEHVEEETRVAKKAKSGKKRGAA